MQPNTGDRTMNHMLNLTLCVYLALLPGVISGQKRCGVTELQARLESNVERYEVSSESFLEALVTVSSDFKLPIGIEGFGRAENARPVRLSFGRTSSREILQRIVDVESGYRLEAGDDIVHVYHKDLRDDPHNFLNLRVRDFSVTDEYVSIASRRLQRQAHAEIAPRPPVGAGEAGSAASGLGDRHVTIRLHDVTYREALDGLALSADFKVWIVAFSNSVPPMSTGLRRTVTSEGGNPGQDWDQPFWELLPWGAKPY